MGRSLTIDFPQPIFRSGAKRLIHGFVIISELLSALGKPALLGERHELDQIDWIAEGSKPVHSYRRLSYVCIP
jgi:hypothetical protein